MRKDPACCLEDVAAFSESISALCCFETSARTSEGLDILLQGMADEALRSHAQVGRPDVVELRGHEDSDK
jgi:hypothetical protein